MSQSFKARLNLIKQSHIYRVEKAKFEFVRGITRIMKLKGISNTELATRLETSNAYVTKALRGDSNFTIDSMIKITHAVGGNLHIHVADEKASVRWLEKHTFKDRVVENSKWVDMNAIMHPAQQTPELNRLNEAFDETCQLCA
jgi:transcriptional regulator with XRE-family HTH domain